MSENIYEEALVIEKSSKYTYVTCPKYAEDIRIPHWIGEIRNIQLQMWDSVGITTVIDNIAFKFCLLKRASSIPNVDEETETELLINRLHIRSLQLELNDAESRLKQLNRQLKMMEQSKELANFNCCVCLTNQPSVVLIPCNHASICSQCRSQLDTCPICRTKIIHSINIFLN